MKKSNKLLLGGFLTVILIIAGIHIALYAKYKNGHYTLYHPVNEWANDRMQSFPGVSFVIFRNVGGAYVQFGDRAQVEKGKMAMVKYEQKGDSLIITGHYINANQHDERRQVNFTLPYNVTLSTVNSSLYFENFENTAGINPVMNLQHSQVFFFPRDTPFLLGSVKVIASDSSFAGFQGNIQINQLDVQLSNSSFEYTRGEVGQISIVTDSLSRLSLQSKHLLKAKITTVPNNH